MLDSLLELIQQSWIFGALFVITGVAWLASKNFTPVNSLMLKFSEKQSTQTIVSPPATPTATTDTTVSPLPHFSVNVRGDDEGGDGGRFDR